jgi:choline-glycine betaine transporter
MAANGPGTPCYDPRVDVYPYAITALLLLGLCLLIWDRYSRIRRGLQPEPPPSRVYGWWRVIWAVAFGAFTIWVFAGWLDKR